MKKTTRDAVNKMKKNGKKYNTYELAKSYNLGYVLLASILFIIIILSIL